jgi:tetratricopeptide (TPR) repeat protein
MLERHYHQAALEELTKLSPQLEAEGAASQIRAEAMRLTAVAHLGLEHMPQARAAARRAVDLDDGCADPHATLAQALVRDGDPALALDEADRSIAIDPNTVRGWGAKARVQMATGHEVEEPPPAVAAHRDYKLALTEIRCAQDRWAEALDLASDLIQEPSPSPFAHFFHAQALLALAETDDTRRADLHRAEEELTALIDSLRLDHPLYAPARFTRGQVRELLGDHAGAAGDEAYLQQVNGRDPGIVEQTVTRHALRGDMDGALRVLDSSMVPTNARLLAMRAGLLAQKGRRDEAARDLDAANQALDFTENPDQVRYQLGEVSIDLGDVERARGFLADMSADARSAPMGELLSALIAFASGDAEGGKGRFWSAIAAEPDVERQRLLRVRLAMSLREGRRPIEALAILEEIGLDQLPDDEIQAFVMTAFEAGDLGAAKQGIERLAVKGPLPKWALSVRADIGLRTDDPEAVMADLLALERAGASTSRVHLTLARCLIELGRKQDALSRVSASLDAPITPGERIEAAIYLRNLDHRREAIAQAFLAYREDRRDPRIQRVLASMVFMAGDNLPDVDCVAAGTHVKLVRPDGTQRHHSIFAEPPLEKAVGELSVEEAELAGLIGLKVGDQVVRRRAPLPDEVETVEEIVPAEVHAARTIVDTFEDNFPAEPHFVTKVHVGDGDEVGDLAGVLAVLGERRGHVRQVLELYRRGGFPLEFIANLLGVKVPELIAGAADPDTGPLLVEWSDRRLYNAAVQAARDATTLIVTRSALETAERHELLAVLEAHFEIISPRSLEWALREEEAAAADAVTTGRRTIASTPRGLSLNEIEPGHPDLAGELARVRSALEWVVEKTRRMPRPVEGVRNAAAADEKQHNQDEVRARLGQASFDAATLAAHDLGTLYCDDLGLRRYAVRGSKPPTGVSTVSLVDGLVIRGLVSPRDRGRIHADLILAGYVHVPPSDDLLSQAMDRMPALGIRQFRAIFATFGGPLATPEVEDMVGRALKRVAVQTIERVSLEAVTEASVLAFAQRIARPAAAALLKAVAQRELRLLPQALARVERTCDRLAAANPPIVAA